MLTFKQCMEEMLEVIDRKRMLLPVPWWVAELQASVLGLLPNPPLTKDQVTLLRTDNVVSKAAEGQGRTIAAIGIAPQDHGLDPADLSLALPRRRPVHPQDGSLNAG